MATLKFGEGLHCIVMIPLINHISNFKQTYDYYPYNRREKRLHVNIHTEIPQSGYGEENIHRPGFN